MRTVSFFAIVITGLVACGGGAETAPPATPSSTTPTSNPSPAAESAAPKTFAEQVAAGQKLYAEKCASCHGAGGEGGKGPKVVGVDKGALPLDPPPNAKFRKTQFRTAADVAGFVVKNMPPPSGDPSLKESDYWSILAFDLHANGVDLPAKIDGSNAASVVLHK
jgi:cytochrome c